FDEDSSSGKTLTLARAYFSSLFPDQFVETVANLDICATLATSGFANGVNALLNYSKQNPNYINEHEEIIGLYLKKITSNKQKLPLFYSKEEKPFLALYTPLFLEELKKPKTKNPKEKTDDFLSHYLHYKDAVHL
ncbi:MAG: hypothetical protein AABX98_01750, partial [Nanoarchaeota archaeon]